MWEVFKILLLCLISIFIAILTTSWLYTCALFFVIVLIFYDFDFTTGAERHAVNKLKYTYLKVRNLYTVISHRESSISRFQYTPIMNSVNKQTSSFELSRFNKSGNALSPITNSASNLALTSRRLIQSRQTSTPLSRTSPWQKNNLSSATNNLRTPPFHNSIVNRSPRYSLSSVNLTPKSESNELSPRPTIQTVTGPLLASTRFNVNLGTYTDTKSPGLASRVVQYHNELSGDQTSTHQTKYGSPGQFPIVQLYKKELPILARTPRRCTVRIAPPDPVSYNSDQANAILRDSFVQNSVDNPTRQGDTEINTRSVLEALKEISRKRIHTNDDIDDISKRQRVNSVSSPSTTSEQLNKDGKRMREDTPPKPKESSSTTSTTPVNSAPKRICVVNEIESSLSSSRLMRLQQGQKRKATLNMSENNKQRRISNGELVSRQTQTTITNGTKSLGSPVSLDSSKTTQKISTAAQTDGEKEENHNQDIQQILQTARRKKKPNGERSIRDIDEENSTLQFSKINNNPSKAIFSEEPLEIMKKNKLALMLSALSGQEPEIIPLPNVTLSAMKEAEKDNPDGTNKEVVSILSPKNKAKHDKHVTFAIPASENDITDSSKSDKETAVIVSAAPSNPLSNIQFKSAQVLESNNITSLPYSISVTPINSSSVTTSTSLMFPTLSVASNNSASPSSTVPKSNFNFGSAITATSMATATNNLGFNAVTTTTVATNVVASPSVDSKDKPAINFGAGAANLNFTSPTFGNGAGSLKTPAFGGLVPSSGANSATEKSAVSISAVPSYSLPTTNTLTSPVSSNGTSMFGSPVTTSVISFPVTTATNSISQGGTKLPSAFTPVATSIATTPANSGINFGATIGQQPSLFPSTTASFGTAAPAVNATSSLPLFNFANKTEVKTSTTASSFTFGGSTATTQSPPKTGGFKFDLGKTSSPGFTSKTESTKPPVFGTGGSTTLNKSGTFSFGGTSTTSTTPSAPNTTKASIVFGASPATTSPGAFGSTPTTTANTFGTPNTTASANVFGTPNTTPGFGAPNAAPSSGAFGVPNTTSNTGVFGAPNTTASSGAFGVASTTSTGGVFGAPSTTASTGVFGAPAATTTTASTGAFGTPNTTASTGVFGAPSTNANAGIFGATASAPPAFGSTKTENPPNFGGFGTTGSAQPPAFGNFSTPTTTQSASAFGAFGTPTTTQSNAFGGTPATTTSSFAFGANTTTKAFSFGATTTATTTTAPVMFGSTAPTATATNLFGGNTSSGFGSTTAAPSAFGSTTTTTAQSTFGQQPSTGVFGSAASNFGTGTSGPVFGSSSTTAPASNNNNNAFGSSAPPAFGTPNQQPSTFGATGTTTNQANVFGQPSTGMFGGTNTNSTTTFGSASNTSFGSNFSGNTAQQAPGFGAFGAPATQAQPAGQQQSGVFSFGGPAQAAAAAPSAPNAFQFGGAAQAPKPAGFNFSANANAPNISFGAGAAPSFSASPAPAFGSPAQGQFNAAPPSTGMFNIGSGSTAPKQRPMIKARRRN